MKKILLLVSSIVFGGIFAQSQIFSETFDNDIPSSWTILDEDNFTSTTSQSAYASWAWNSGNELASSSSWYDNNGTGPTDDWLITPAINIPASGVFYLNYDGSSSEANFLEEYEVLLSTTGTATADFTTTLLSITDEPNAVTPHSVDLSAHLGETIHIAFRHISDDESMLNIDNVEVIEVSADDMEITEISIDKSIVGDRTFTITCTNVGQNDVTDFDLDWSFDGGTVTTENITGINLSTGQSHDIDVNINGVQEGVSKTFNAEITTADDDMSNNTLDDDYSIYPPVPQYVATDSKGNEFDLHAALSNGQAIILDFMASWCGPCESSTPEISELVENNGSGEENLEALAISIEQNDDDAVINGLDWNGGFYEYPKFSYNTDNSFQYFHYSSNHGFNSGSIPFFVMICPDIADPAYSTIVKHDVGFGAGMFAAYQTELDNCPTATADLIEEVDDNISLNVYPNPTSGNATVKFNFVSASNTTVTVTNAVGQNVYFEDLGVVEGENTVQIDTERFDAGIYTVTVNTEYSQTNTQLSVLD
ncbi:MAG: choice-of-anchor J domain-containing protein [Brumimicrobium sp.]